MKNILCYGDSNTFGSIPGGGRYPYGVRWPGRLAGLLGADWHLIEEGMGGRTTVWEDPLEPGRCGIRYLPVALCSHQPLDMVIVSLGTNDCKASFHAPAGLIAQGLGRILSCIQHHPYTTGRVPDVIVVSPIAIGEACDVLFPAFDHTSVEKARRLAPLFERTAKANGCLFLDAARVAGPSSRDHLHMDPEGHAALADALARLIRQAGADRAAP
mgnify:FL=1